MLIIIGNQKAVNEIAEEDVWNKEDPYTDWNRLTECEKNIFQNRIQIYYGVPNQIEVEHRTQQKIDLEIVTSDDLALHNTIGDAYRHAYFFCIKCQKL